MATARATTLEVINRFIKGAEKTIDVRKVVLFGSHATGLFNEWSDIDIAIISDDFEGTDNHERLLRLSKIGWQQEATEIDALGFTQAEFESDDPLSLVTEIKEHGIVVYEKF